MGVEQTIRSERLVGEKQNACIGLSEDCLEDWCREHKKNKDYSLVLLVEENCDFYTDREGLVGNNKKQEE